ncbi:uncharacterized protein J3R85_016743 [Psidium guajava]|nr:uncharacterized protein J3R85_016743 [Psidium guajava]
MVLEECHLHAVHKRILALAMTQPMEVTGIRDAHAGSICW